MYSRWDSHDKEVTIRAESRCGIPFRSSAFLNSIIILMHLARIKLNFVISIFRKIVPSLPSPTYPEIFCLLRHLPNSLFPKVHSSSLSWLCNDSVEFHTEFYLSVVTNLCLKMTHTENLVYLSYCIMTLRQDSWFISNNYHRVKPMFILSEPMNEWDVLIEI